MPFQRPMRREMSASQGSFLGKSQMLRCWLATRCVGRARSSQFVVFSQGQLSLELVNSILPEQEFAALGKDDVVANLVVLFSSSFEMKKRMNVC